MKTKTSRVALFASLLITWLSAGTASVHAYPAPYGAAAVGLDGLDIYSADEVGEVIYSSPWLLSVTTAANGSTSASDSQSGTDEFYVSQSLTPESDGAAIALNGNECCTGTGFTTSTSGGVAGIYAASGSGTAIVQSTFRISPFEEGAEGNAEIWFDAYVLSAIFAESYGVGNSAGASGYFKLFLSGGQLAEEIAVINETYSVASNEGEGMVGSEFEDEFAYYEELTLDFNTDYTLRIELSASSYAFSDGTGESSCGECETPVPEPSTVLATSIGFGLLAFHRFRKRARA